MNPFLPRIEADGDLNDWRDLLPPAPQSLDVLSEDTYPPLPSDPSSGAALVTVHPLEMTDNTSGGAAIVNVAQGQVGGRAADSGMTSDGFDVTLTGSGTRYIYCEVTWGYSAPAWTSSACAIVEKTAVTAATSTKQYVLIGTAERESDGAGGYQVKISALYNNLSGSQRIARTGSSTNYGDEHCLI